MNGLRRIGELGFDDLEKGVLTNNLETRICGPRIMFLDLALAFVVEAWTEIECLQASAKGFLPVLSLLQDAMQKNYISNGAVFIQPMANSF